ncbi:unnamed protein product [Linum tenue]|uniref:RNase H type-1 domain-containing protein n=2 Tax=Linum tenue TaxID=586396 RepID=A0AAV0P976_9ROSI|nr:unnamed protein product [Linum tenue]
MAEALAAEFGVQLACQLGYNNLMLEVDCLTLVEKLAKLEEVHTEIGLIGRSITNYLGGEAMIEGCIRHVRRGANNAAHIMTHSKTHWDSREVWLERPPIYLVDQLKLDDVTSISS